MWKNATVEVDEYYVSDFVNLMKLSGISIVGSRVSLVPNTVLFVVEGPSVPFMDRCRAVITTTPKENGVTIDVEFKY